MNKKDTKQHLALSDQVNIGLKPANGLKPPKPDLAELDQDMKGKLGRDFIKVSKCNL